MLRYLTSEEVDNVTAICRTLSGEDITVEDIASVSMELSNGMIATFTWWIFKSRKKGTRSCINTNSNGY